MLDTTRLRLNLQFGQRKYLRFFVLLLGISVICVAFSMGSGDGFNKSRREILLRRLRHEVLLQSGDSTSRILPVKKISAHEYRISFEKAFSFQPDSLVSTSRRLLGNEPSASDYIVNVLHCGTSTVAYGYAVSSNQKDDIIACTGRVQPKDCYTIQIKFKPEGIITEKQGYLLGGLFVMAFVGLLSFRSIKPRSTAIPEAGNDSVFTLGSLQFDPRSRTLVQNGEVISLTGTETRVLLIFASSPNEIIERSRLQKEVWEDEGVIVGRSLDVFISKLRKKLECDPSIRIAVVRGKGYKLETGALKA